MLGIISSYALNAVIKKLATSCKDKIEERVIDYTISATTSALFGTNNNSEKSQSFFEKIVNCDPKKILAAYAITSIVAGAGMLALAVVNPHIALAVLVGYVALSVLTGGAIATGKAYYKAKATYETALQHLNTCKVAVQGTLKTTVDQLQKGLNKTLTQLNENMHSPGTNKTLAEIAQHEQALGKHIAGFKKDLTKYREQIDQEKSKIEEQLKKCKTSANNLENIGKELPKDLRAQLDKSKTFQSQKKSQLAKIKNNQNRLENLRKNLIKIEKNIENLNLYCRLLKKSDDISTDMIAAWNAYSQREELNFVGQAHVVVQNAINGSHPKHAAKEKARMMVDKDRIGSEIFLLGLNTLKSLREQIKKEINPHINNNESAIPTMTRTTANKYLGQLNLARMCQKRFTENLPSPNSRLANLNKVQKNVKAGINENSNKRAKFEKEIEDMKLKQAKASSNQNLLWNFGKMVLNEAAEFLDPTDISKEDLNAETQSKLSVFDPI